MTHPVGTKAWRKGWRKRWHEGSSYRQLTLLQRVLLHWVEENANDEGMAGPTTRVWLAKLMSCPSERVSKSSVHRAAVTLERAGMVRREAGQVPGRVPGHAPMLYIRENWAEYQDKPDKAGQDPGKVMSDTRDDLAEEGRREQKKQKKEETTPPEAALPPDTDWPELLKAMTESWATRHGGKKLALLGRDFKPLRALVVSLTDVEVWRRWEIYLANPDPFYTGHPVSLFCSQVNRFVDAPAREPSFKEPWEGESPKGLKEWRENT